MQFPHKIVSSVVVDPIYEEPPLGKFLKELTTDIFVEHPRMQPLAMWKSIRENNPHIVNSIDSFRVVQNYVKYLRSVCARNTGSDLVIEFSSQIDYVEVNSIWEKINLRQSVKAFHATNFDDFVENIGISDVEKEMTIPISDRAREVIQGLEQTKLDDLVALEQFLQ